MFWRESRKRKRQLEETCLKVLGKFPQVSRYEITLEYDRSADKNCPAFYKTGDIKEKGGTNAIDLEPLGYLHIKPTIVVGPLFFEYKTGLERETTLAHEVGHYLEYKNISSQLMRRKTFWACWQFFRLQ